MKIKKIILILIVVFAFISKLFAIETPPGIYVNEDYETNIIEENYTDNTVTYEKNTNTLTLDGFHGKSIYIDGFDVEDDFTIILKGENVFDGKIDDVSDFIESAIYMSTIDTLKIIGEENSSLKISNYSYGINVTYGNLSINKTKIIINNAVVGIYSEDGSQTYEENEIEIKDVYGGIEDICNGPNNEKINIKSTYIKIDNEESNKHLISGILAITKEMTIEKSNIIINNNSNNNYSPSSKYLDINDMHSALSLYESGIMCYCNPLIIKDSYVKIDAIYTSKVANKTQKNGIINFGGLTNLDNSEMHINVDENGGAICSADFSDFEMLSLKGNAKITNDGYELQRYPFINDAFIIYSIGISEVDASGIILEDETEVFKYFGLMSSKVDIEGTFDLIYDSNDESHTEKKVSTTGYIYKLPTDIFPSTDKRVFKGWSLTKNGDTINPLHVSVNNNTTLYAIWDDPRTYEYKFVLDDNEFYQKNVTLELLKIDGSYLYFDKLELEGIDLIKDTDYIVSEGSTIITFTNSGINKLNSLEVGTHKLIAKYTNGNNVEGNIIIKEKIKQENPKTGDNVTTYFLTVLISILFLVRLLFIRKECINDD